MNGSEPDRIEQKSGATMAQSKFVREFPAYEDDGTSHKIQEFQELQPFNNAQSGGVVTSPTFTDFRSSSGAINFVSDGVFDLIDGLGRTIRIRTKEAIDSNPFA